MRRLFGTLIPLLLMSGCGSKPVTHLYDKARAGRIDCLKLSILPPNPAWQRLMQRLYPFDETCKTTLQISYKCGIVCNSNQNAPRKALSAFPDSYLRMEVSEGLHRIYSYYIDLQEGVSERELRRGFARVRKDLKLGEAR